MTAVSFVETLSQQAAAIGSAPIPFAIGATVVGTVVWKFVNAHYTRVIETLQHRLALRDDTISQYEKGAPLPNELHISAKHNVISHDLGNEYSVTDKEIREFVSPSITPKDLRETYADKTDIQGKRQSEIYLGRWIEVSGLVHDVYEYTKGRNRIRLHDVDTDQIGLRGLWLTFDKPRSVIETLKKGDRLICVGKIEKISQFDVQLDHCELIKAE